MFGKKTLENVHVFLKSLENQTNISIYNSFEMLSIKKNAPPHDPILNISRLYTKNMDNSKKYFILLPHFVVKPNLFSGFSST